MCGRYSTNKGIKEIEEQLKANASKKALNWKPSYNIAPTQLAPVITADDPKTIDLMHFGLVPFWAKDVKIGSKMINARAETIMEKGSFKPLLTKGKRCLVFADSFYEWKKDGAEKQPYRIKMVDRDLFAFAGLWSKWKDPEGEDYYSFSIITTSPNELMTEVHNRMPVVLTKEDEKAWIDLDQNPDDLLQLLSPYPSDGMDMYMVSKEVGNVRNNHPGLLNSL